MFYFEVDSVAFFILIECEMTRTKVINSPKNTIEEKEIKAGGSYPLKPEPHLTKNTRFVIRTSKSGPEAQLFLIALVTLLCRSTFYVKNDHKRPVNG